MNFEEIKSNISFDDNYSVEDAENSKLKYYGGNFDSNEAYFGIDLTADEVTHQTVSVDKFNWDVKHSNDCVRGKSDKGSGDGKFFSFYLARHVFKDALKINVKNIVSTKYDAIAGRIKPLGSTGYVAVVIFLHSGRIITSWCITDENDVYGDALTAYLENKYGEPEELSLEKFGETNIPEYQMKQITKASKLYERRKLELMERERAVLIRNGHKFREYVLANF
jgi:hypothetical protein